MLMNNRAAVVHFPDSLPTKWSLSKRDKRRLKQILALVAAIVALLWLLYQLGQYTAAMGADQQNKIHVDGDRKMTVHANPGFQHGSSAGGVGEGNKIARALPPPLPGAPRQTSAPDGASSDQAVPAPLSNRDNQSSVAGTAGTDTQQQVAAGPNSNDPPFFGYGNLPMPWIASGGGAGSSGDTSDKNSGNSGGNGGGNSGGNSGSSGSGNSGSDANGGGNSGGNGGVNSGGNGGSSGPSGNPPADSTPGPGDNGRGANPGSSPGDGPDIFPNPDGPLFGNGSPDSGGGGTTGTPLTVSTSGPASATIPAPTVEVPEPDSIALFGGGLLVLLIALRRQRGLRHNRPQASWKEFAGVDPHEGCGPTARGAAGLAMRRMCLAVVMGVASLAIIAGPASAETATVYGTTASIFSPYSGAFLPANTNLTCFSMNEANCWDGKKWQHLYPSGRRHYAVAKTDRIACSVIMAPSNDCWTGSVWYRLPKGQLFGVIGGFFSNMPGAFITAPLRSPAVTYTATSLRSPLGEFASKR